MPEVPGSRGRALPLAVELLQTRSTVADRRTRGVGARFTGTARLEVDPLRLVRPALKQLERQRPVPASTDLAPQIDSCLHQPPQPGFACLQGPGGEHRASRPLAARSTNRLAS